MGVLSTCSLDAAPAFYQQTRRAHWDQLAEEMDVRHSWGGYYRQRLAEVYRSLIPPGRRVLEIGCCSGDLLDHLEPAAGVGIDFSQAMVERARRRHPHLRFLHTDAHDLDLDETFDFIILSDLVNDLWDVQGVLMQVARLTAPGSRIILNTHSHAWTMPLWLAERLGLARPRLRQNWLTPEDLANLLRLSGFEVLRSWQEVLCPLRIPLLAPLCNKYLVRLSPFKQLALANFLIARPAPEPRTDLPSVSVVIPARNEAGNIEQILARIPEMGAETELIFVEGNSTDDTYEAIERALENHPERQAMLLHQSGKGKGDAVRKGFEHASGDILMILDADLSVPPEDLPRFYEAIRTGQGELINGVRMVYPMEEKAMRFANLLGNKFFSLAFSWMLGTSIKDTLCGTKVLWRKDYELIAANRSYFGDFDPFGDFDLLFGAAKLNLKIIDMPVRYRERVYGTTNIQRWRHGWMLLNMVFFAADKIKFQ
jgi:SAM-dependent methyltransferase